MGMRSARGSSVAVRRCCRVDTCELVDPPGEYVDINGLSVVGGGADGSGDLRAAWASAQDDQRRDRDVLLAQKPRNIRTVGPARETRVEQEIEYDDVGLERGDESDRLRDVDRPRDVRVVPKA